MGVSEMEMTIFVTGRKRLTVAAFGRRNLNDGQKYLLVSQKREILLEKGRQKMSEAVSVANQESPKKNPLSGLPETGKPEKKTESHNTRKEIAKDLKWSTGKVSQADKVFKSNDEETKRKVIQGEVSIRKAYEHVKQEEQKAQIAKPPAPNW